MAGAFQIETGQQLATTLYMDVLLMDRSHFENIVMQRVFENERYAFGVGWGHTPGCLRENEERWVYTDGWGLFKTGSVWGAVAPEVPRDFEVS